LKAGQARAKCCAACATVAGLMKFLKASGMARSLAQCA